MPIRSAGRAAGLHARQVRHCQADGSHRSVGPGRQLVVCKWLGLDEMATTACAHDVTRGHYQPSPVDHTKRRLFVDVWNAESALVLAINGVHSGGLAWPNENQL